GTDSSITVGNTVNLSGAASTDIDGDSLTYQWQFETRPEGSSASLSNATSITPSFIADIVGNFVVSLVVNDGQTNSSADNVVITATILNQAPIANAGVDINSTVGNTINLTGLASSDINEDALTYAWQFDSRPGDSNATLSDTTSATPTFMADVEGNYVVNLVVNDGQLSSTSDSVTVTITAATSAPIANAGVDSSAIEGDTVTLSGAASTNGTSDGTLTYLWNFQSKPGDSSATLLNATTVSPSFIADAPGNYIVTLVVNNGDLSSETDTVTITVTAANKPPIANAGLDSSTIVGDTVSLSGLGSSDPDGDALTYSWQLTLRPDNSSASLSNAASVSPTFIADIAGDYVVNLIVNDGSLDSEADTVTISAAATNGTPVASAGEDIAANLGGTVTLSGVNSADPDGDELTYLWQFDARPEASSTTLENPTSVTPTFIADVVGDFVVILVVNDGIIDSAVDPVTITVTDTNHAPIANAGEDITANTGDTITLSGALSTDADGDSLSYTWQFVSQPPGSTASMRDQTAQSPTFIVDLSGSYIVSLTVNDGRVNSAADEVTVTVVQSNNAPIAEAGANQLVTVGESVTLSGAGSTDEDGDTLTYAWQIDSKPDTSTAELTNATSVSPSLLADVVGSYVISLTVNDGQTNSTADTVTLNAQAADSTFALSSKAFKTDLILPLSATCDGANKGSMPQLSWTDAPEGTQSFALTLHSYPNPDDAPDLSKAHGYIVLYDIPQVTTTLADGQTSVGTFGINSIDATQAFSAPCSKDPISNTYTVTLYALSNEVGSLPLETSSTDLSALTNAILTTTLGSATVELNRVRYNPNNDEHVPSSVPSDCASKSAAFTAYSNLVSVSCDDTNMTITSKTMLPYRSSLDGDKPDVGIKSWIGRVAIAEETSWTLPLQPNYFSSTISNINIHDAIGVSVEGVPILHYAKEASFDEVAQLGTDYSDRDTVLLGEVDQCGAHAGNGEDYHYHTAPLCLMDTHDPSKPLAYMFDGIPLYFGTGGGVLTTDGTDYGAGRYSALDYRPQKVKTGERPLDECNAYDVNGDGSEYVYYSSAAAPYTIACYRATADQSSSVTPGPHWKVERDLAWAGSDVDLTDHNTMTFNSQSWTYTEITPGDSNNNIPSGKKALIMYRQLVEGDSDYDTNSNCYTFRYRLDSTVTDGSDDTVSTHCR
ncbi:MAG: PKD domain-containing protein, partial [Psychrosphaera sp.]|nr:PKD domain-containing protein [Psychrosphaera sp.]